MNGGFRALVNPPTRVTEVDLDATRGFRQRLHDEIGYRNHIVWLLQVSEPGGDAVRVTPYEECALPDGDSDSFGELIHLPVGTSGEVT